MNRLAASPLRNLTSIVAFVFAVVVLATFGYMRAGWSFQDAIYMVLITVYTVGYQEVRPINRVYLHVVTLSTVVLGCTGMILFTGAMVQVFTSLQIKELLGLNRVKSDVDKLKDHVIVAASVASASCWPSISRPVGYRSSCSSCATSVSTRRSSSAT